MAAAYTWHPGSGRVVARWAVPVPLLPDEVFSSWLARAALVQGCDPLILSGEIWPGWRVWARDPDRGLPGDRMKALEDVSGINGSVFELASLRPVAKSVSACDLEVQTIWPWVLSLGYRNRKRRGGLQYCPECLAEDPGPYYRLQWRLAWHTACKGHGQRLRDCCPNCHGPLEPHRLTGMDATLAVCARCHGDLRAPDSHAPDRDAIAFQNEADRVAQRGSGDWGRTRLSVAEWFELARYFVSLLRKAALGRNRGLDTALEKIGIDPDSLAPSSTGLALEVLTVGERTALMGDAGKLMQAGPERLMAATQDAGVTAQALREIGRRVPRCLYPLIDGLPEDRRESSHGVDVYTMKPRSRQVVSRMWARLQRKMTVDTE